MQKEASRAGYIGVWILAGVISGLSSGVVSSILIAQYIQANGSGSITAAIVMPAVVGALAWCLTYMFFPNINTRKVVPYHLIGGILAIVISFAQVATYKNTSLDISAVIPLTAILWVAILIFLIKRAETFEQNILPSHDNPIADREWARSKVEETGDSAYKYVPRPKPEASPEPAITKKPKVGLHRPPPTSYTRPDVQPAQKPPAQPSEAPGKAISASVETQPDPYANARIAIEYREDADIAWKGIQSLPETYQIQFLEALDEDPKADPTFLAERLLTESRKTLRPYADEEMNDLLERCRKINDGAELEFMEVYELLGDKINPKELFGKIEAKFLSPEWMAQKKTDDWKPQ